MSELKFNERWTCDETETALSLRKKGLSEKEIGTILNRTPEAVRARLAWLQMTPDRLAKKAAAARQRRYAKGAVPRAWAIGDRTVNARPDPSALAEQVRRMALAPRNLTAWVCGDPLPGCSALERRPR